VKEKLEHLKKLQKTDSTILDKRHAIDVIPSKISSVEKPLKDSVAQYDKLKQHYEALEKKKRDKDRALDDINEKINKLKTRITDIKTNKEYQAHLKEIESTEKERYSLEDNILMLMEEMEISLHELKSQDIIIKKEKTRIEEYKKILETEMHEAEKELTSLRDERAKIVKSIDTELYEKYISLIEPGNGVVVIEAKDYVCQGCNMNIPPQLFVEIRKNEEIMQCPQCHRILYFNDENREPNLT
jgi:predicted  nucleic acid-binding Zn-ribbon protein